MLASLKNVSLCWNEFGCGVMTLLNLPPKADPLALRIQCLGVRLRISLLRWCDIFSNSSIRRDSLQLSDCLADVETWQCLTFVHLKTTLTLVGSKRAGVLSEDRHSFDCVQELSWQ